MIDPLPVPVLQSWLTNPLWDQFAVRPTATHPLGCRRRRVPDRIACDKLRLNAVHHPARPRMPRASAGESTSHRDPPCSACSG